MGKPILGHTRIPCGSREVSGGTETSKYPEENKSKEIPLVVANERGKSSNLTDLVDWGPMSDRGCNTASLSPSESKE